MQAYDPETGTGTCTTSHHYTIEITMLNRRYLTTLSNAKLCGRAFRGLAFVVSFPFLLGMITGIAVCDCHATTSVVRLVITFLCIIGLNVVGIVEFVSTLKEIKLRLAQIEHTTPVQPDAGRTL